MSASGVGFYEDAAKVTTIIESRGNFKTERSRDDDENAGEYRLSDGTLESYSIWAKKEYILKCSGIRQSDLDTLKTEYDLQREFYFYPDVYNLPTTYYHVKWARGWKPKYIEKDERYSLNIKLKEV